ncbi:MAG: Lar family restriction alleviation protein [Atopobiaceae bacterium]|nr:Lar family restriction alleviation protein [Atopobiaceae bacterium]
MSDCSTHAFDALKKHCPFCGERDYTVKFSGRWGYFVSCKYTAVGPSRRTREAAIEAWNTRREPEPDTQESLF